MIKWKNLDPSLQSMLASVGIPGVADVHYVTTSTSNAVKAYWDRATGGVNKFTSISGAHSGATSGRNDVILLSPESHSQAAKITWSKNMTHLIGMYGPAMMNQRSRIGHSANFATMLDVTGYGNTFANLYFMYGRGSATNTNLLTVTGDRNTFYRCHFGGPMHATEAGTAGFTIAEILGTENYFKNCVFGISSMELTAAINTVKFGGSGYDPRTIFEDCIFLANAGSGAAGSFFFKTQAGVGESFAIFRNCQMINIGGTALTYGIDGTGSSAQKLIFSGDSYFIGCTDVVAAAYEGNVFFPANNYASSDKLYNGLAINPDVS